MTDLSLHNVWLIMKETSAAQAGDPEYQEAAAAHFQFVEGLTQEEAAAFHAQSDVVKYLLQQFSSGLEKIAQDIIAEKGITDEVWKWGATEIISYVAGAQTKGAYADILVNAMLAQQDLAALFDFVEPAASEEIDVDTEVEEEEVDGN